MEGQLIHYKNEAGEWVPLPISVIGVYDMYVAYCTDNGITPVDKITYYTNLTEITTALNNVRAQLGDLSNLENLQQVVGALEDGLLPVTMGGLGKSFASETQLLEYLSDSLQSDTYSPWGYTLASKGYVEEKIAAIPEDKRFASGNFDPSQNPSSVPSGCTMFFQYE